MVGCSAAAGELGDLEHLSLERHQVVVPRLKVSCRLLPIPITQLPLELVARRKRPTQQSVLLEITPSLGR